MTDMEDNIREEFEMFGLEVDTIMLAAMVSYSNNQRKDAATLASDWIAYQENTNKELNLENFRHFSLEKARKEAQLADKKQELTKVQKTPLQDNTDDNFLSTYGYTGPTTPDQQKTKRVITTPDQPSTKRRSDLNGTPQNIIHGAPGRNDTPKCKTPAGKYQSRKDPGKVEEVYPEGNSSWPISDPSHHSLVALEADLRAELHSQNFKYMFQKLYKQVEVIDRQIEALCEDIRESTKSDKSSMADLANPLDASSSPVCVNGMICCDCDEKLNSQSVMLQGTVGSAGGHSVKLSLEDCQSYSLFAGQKVVIEGTNPDGKCLKATNIYTPSPLPAPTIDSSSGFSCVFASGPFAPDKSDDDAPLHDLLSKISLEQPNIVILTGPFLDEKNETLSCGEDFQTRLQTLLDTVMTGTVSVNPDMQLVLIPSHRDLSHEPVFPTPAYSLRSSQIYLQHQSRVHLLSDPCTFSIDGVTFGVVAADVLVYLLMSEISRDCPSSDRLARAFSHLLSQRSFLPCTVTDNVFSVDRTLAVDRAAFHASPHILITPSNLSRCVKVVGDTVCINPGTLCKGTTGHTYLQLYIEPISEPTINVQSHLQAKVVRI